VEDDDLLTQIGDLGAAINASRDENLDPDLQALAGGAADTAAEQLANDSKRK
jgi:hypothetical protein